MFREMILVQNETLPEIKGLILKYGIRKHYRKNNYIIGEAVITDKCYYIEIGLCAYLNSTFNGNNKILGLLAPGATFGEVPSALQEYTATAVICLEKVTVLEVPYVKLVSMLEKENWHRYTRFLLQKSLRYSLLSIYINTLSVTQRVLYFFKLYSMKEPELTADGFYTMRIKLTQERFAEIVGAGRNTVNAILNRLKKKKLLYVANRNIIFSKKIVDDSFIEKSKII